MPRPRPRRARSGYSLVECVLAAGLLAGILVSISGLFVIGTRSVRSGRELTKATTIANSAVEQVLGWNYEKVYGFAGGVGANQTMTWSTDDPNPAYSGSAEDVADWSATADAWRAQVQEELHEGELTYRVDGIARLPTQVDPGLTTFLSANLLRVTVTVAWSEAGQRRRHVTFEELVL